MTYWVPKWKLKGSLQRQWDGVLLEKTHGGPFCQHGHRCERLRQTQEGTLTEADRTEDALLKPARVRTHDKRSIADDRHVLIHLTMHS